MRYLLLSFFLVLSGCAATFKTLQPDYDFGPPPTNFEEKVKNELKYILKDPSSAVYDFRNSKPVKAYTNSGLVAGGEINWAGWVVFYRVNAKNSYGGYTGFETRKAFFTNNEIHRWQYPNSPYANITFVQ